MASISQLALVAAPGTRFDYGSTHLQVAARMAEVVTGAVVGEHLCDAAEDAAGAQSPDLRLVHGAAPGSGHDESADRGWPARHDE